MATSKIKMCDSRRLKHMVIWNNIWLFEMELVCLKKSYLYSSRCIDPFLHNNAICYFFDIIDGHGFYSIVLWLSWHVNAACFSLTWLIPYWFYIIACVDGCFIFDHCSHILVSWRFIQEWTWSALIWKKKIAEKMNGISRSELKFIVFLWDPMWGLLCLCLISENEMRSVIHNKFEEMCSDLIWWVANSCL
jgi:hypothetical protein